MSNSNSKNRFSSIATFTCAGMTLIYLITAISYLIINKLNDGGMTSAVISQVISYFISVIFYFLLTGDFLKSKSNFRYALNGMFVLVLCDYIIPLVFSSINLIIFNGVEGLIAVIILAISCAVAIAYFVLLVVDRKNESSKKSVQIAMIVLGAILVAGGLYNFISSTISYVNLIIKGTLNANQLVLTIFNLIVVIFNFLERFLYLLFPIALNQIRKSGY